MEFKATDYERIKRLALARAIKRQIQEDAEALDPNSDGENWHRILRIYALAEQFPIGGDENG